MTTPHRRRWHVPRVLLAAAALIALSACIINVEYARPGEPFQAREHEALVVGRIRFLEDGREYFPWRPSFTDYERHVWLMRLEDRHATWELHPEPDGSLAVWLRPGDYALVGSERSLQGASRDQDMVAFLRVPAGAAVVMAGEITFSIDHPEGGWFRGLFGTTSVRSGSAPAVLTQLERSDARGAPTVAESLWCPGAELRGLRGAAFESAYRALLDSGCAVRP